MVDTSKPVDRTGNAYCGPLVCAAILGTSTGVVADTLATMRRSKDSACVVNGRIRRMPKGVRGTFNLELFAILERNGFAIEPVDVGARYQRHHKTRHQTHVYTDANFKAWYSSDLFNSALLPVTLLERTARPLWQCLAVLGDGATYVVNTPGHWAIASGGKWCETFTNGAWVELRAAPKSSRKVINAWRVTR
jgi:hypothetical protein